MTEPHRADRAGRGSHRHTNTSKRFQLLATPFTQIPFRGNGSPSISLRIHPQAVPTNRVMFPRESGHEDKPILSLWYNDILGGT